ncbi:unnamed protein product [Rangifer tarandus platyrhynchus]|uniref:Uncharacterized protein n=1 Tax=Rangifer tarandus platyrhynchus TaxID=3082113 RepID=A0AC59YV40_RANTA
MWLPQQTALPGIRVQPSEQARFRRLTVLSESRAAWLPLCWALGTHPPSFWYLLALHMVATKKTSQGEQTDQKLTRKTDALSRSEINQNHVENNPSLVGKGSH